MTSSQAPPRPAPGEEVLRSPQDLDALQRACADDVVRALCVANGYAENPLPESREILWTSVFTDWDTSKPAPPPQIPPAPTHQELAVQVGKLYQDLPPSTCAARQAKEKQKAATRALRRGDKASASRLASAPPKVALHRRAGMPAFLRARLDAKTGGVAWFWSDGNGKGVDAKFVSLEKPETGEGLDLATAQEAALSRHDEVVGFHIECCNASRAAYWMQCRLLRHMGATPRGQRPMNPTAPDFAELQTPKFLWPVAMASRRADEAIKAKRPATTNSMQGGSGKAELAGG